MSRRQSLSFGLWLLLALVPTCSPSMASSTQTIATLATSGQPTTNLTVTTVTMDTNPLHVIQHANWTAVVSRIQDPANRGYIMSTAMTASLILALFGYRFIRVWLFLGGFIAMAASFYVWSPSVFETQFCCGPGTERNKANLSLGLGVIVGVLALWVLKVGIFLTGACCGLAAALGARSILGHLVAFSDHGNFAAIYLIAGMVCGLLALYIERPIIIGTTSFVGSFFFCAGVGYFRHCNFLQVAAVLEHDVIAPLKHEQVLLPPCDHVLVIAWLLLSIVAMVVQYRDPFCQSPPETQSKSLPTHGPGAPHMLVVREMVARRGRGRRTDRRSEDRSSRHLGPSSTMKRRHESGGKASYSQLGRRLRERTERREQRLGQALLEGSSSSDNEGVYHPGRVIDL